MKALLFPGQGSQKVGMGKEIYENYNLVKDIFQEADECLKYSISKIILDGPTDKLQLTENTQPAILTVSYSIYTILKEEYGYNFDSFEYFAGHSLGEYSALVCAEALSFKDAIYLLHERGKSMQNAVPVGKGMMLAVMGTNLPQLEQFINNRKNKDGVCEIANDNSDGQIIISGDKNSILLFQNELKENKIKTIPLNVSAPFHCSLMKPASEIMFEKIKNTNFKNPNKKIISNVTATETINPEKIKDLLIEQIYSSVRWRESIINMSNMGVKNFVEIGPGKILSSMVKRTIKDISCFSINTIDDIKSFNDKFKK